MLSIQKNLWHNIWMKPFSIVSISQCDRAIFVTNFRRWNAPLLISLIGLPDKLSLISAFACFHASDGTSRIVFSDKSSSIRFVSLLKAFGSTFKKRMKKRIKFQVIINKYCVSFALSFKYKMLLNMGTKYNKNVYGSKTWNKNNTAGLSRKNYNYRFLPSPILQ